MDFKKFYIITNCCFIAVIIIFEMAMYFFVGEDVLLGKGKMRVLWICFPIVIVGLSFLRDFIIKRKYKNNDNVGKK